MTEIQKTNIRFAELEIDELIARDKPYIKTWSAGDVGSFNAILNAADTDSEFTFHMRGWSRQRVISGTGAVIEINEMNADQLYQLYTNYLLKFRRKNVSDKEAISYETAESTVIGTWKTMLKNTNQYLVPILLPVVEHFKPLFKEFYDLGVEHGKTAQVPEGFVLVPKEPDADLVNHGHQVFLGHFNEGGQTGGRSLYFAYKAMIEAQEQTND